MSSPLLSNAPTLHSLLRNNPKANQEFQTLVSELKSPVATSTRIEELQKAVENQTQLSQELTETIAKMKRVDEKLVRFIRLLGDVIEPQVSLTSYTFDVREAKSYQIQFTADQIRLLLKHYWDSISQETEQVLMRRFDPAADRKEED